MIFAAALLLLTQDLVPATFDVASVKPARSRLVEANGQKGHEAGPAASFEAEHVTFTARNVNVLTLIVEAYGLKFCRPLAESCAVISGAPAWFTRDRFDIDAKGPAGSIEYDTLQLRKGEAPQLEEKLRNLLAERFHFRAHFEKRERPVYAFTAVGTGTRMKTAAGKGSPPVVFRPVSLPGNLQATQVVGTGATVQELADLYAKFMDRPVIDMTGLSGRFNFTVQYEVDADASGPFAGVTASSLFAAFEEQAGLRLRATRGPVDVLVIDGAERPAGN